MLQKRIVLFHKQDHSNWLRFIIFQFKKENQSAVFPEGFLANTSIEKHSDAVNPFHFQELITDIASRLQLPVDVFQVDPDFYVVVTENAIEYEVALIQIKTLDAPLTEAENIGARMLSLTDARFIKESDRKLLRLGYDAVMEGGR